MFKSIQGESVEKINIWALDLEGNLFDLFYLDTLITKKQYIYLLSTCIYKHILVTILNSL